MSSVTTTIGSGDGLVLTRTWAVESPKASLVLIHGIDEHTGRYEHVGAQFNAAGMSFSGPDLPGFGLSGGHRAYVPSWDVYLEVVEAQLAEARSQEKPVVLYGHSMGGLIALSYALSQRPSPDLLVLSAPALDAEVARWKRALAPLIAKVAPKLAIPAGITGADLSRDEAVGTAYFADPLRTSKDTAQLGAVLFAEMDRVRPIVGALNIPTYVLHGGADSLVPAQFSAPLGELEGVTRRLYPSLRHEMHNEPEKAEVIGDTIKWILANLG